MEGIMSVSMKLVKKGRGEPRDGLVQQGKVHVGLAKKHATELAGAGWPAEKTQALENGVTSLESNVSIQADSRSAARELTRAENEAIDNAKTFVRKLRTALPMALRDAPVAGVDAASFRAGRTLKRSTRKVSAYLVQIRPAVVKLDDSLAPYFGSKKASERLDVVKAALDAAGSEQEVKLLGLPQDTLAVYETKGRVLQTIEDLNRSAKIAFDGQPELIAEFTAMDALERARARRKKGAAQAPAATTPTPEVKPEPKVETKPAVQPPLQPAVQPDPTPALNPPSP
jgi:hypothetical protein